MTFIKDKNGQWAHPGKNTLIPDADGNITMKGVNYPVLGIDDEGNQQIMMPGGEYKFPGNDVYEIPLPKYQMLGGVDKVRKVKDAKNVIRPIINWGQNTFPSIFGTPPPSILDKPNLFNVPDLSVRPKTFEEWDWYINKHGIQNKGGLQINSLMGDNSILRNTDKRGNVNINTLIQFSNNVDNLADKAVLKKSIDDVIATVPANVDDVNKYKIPYKVFEEQVQNNLIQFTPKQVDKYADVGMKELGFDKRNELSGTLAPSQEEYDAAELAYNSIQNKTILWQNDKIGNPVSDNHFPTEDLGPTYGHTRFFSIDGKTFNILEIQSDEFQRPLLAKLKKSNEYVIEAQNKIDAKQYKIDNFVPDQNSIMPDNQQWQNYTSQAREEIKYLKSSLKDAESNRDKIQALLQSRSDVQTAQLKNLEKNHSRRLFSETIGYALDNNYQTVRFPHASTVATIEGFGGGQASLADRLENPWTLENIAEYEKAINSMNTGNTYGHTTVAKRHGPFVSIPKEVNSVYSLDNSPRITHEEKGWAPKKTTKPRRDVYADDASYRESLYKSGWSDAEIDAYTANIGHWKNNHIALDNDGRYTINTRSSVRTGDDETMEHLEIPVETAKNLQAGTYHIQDDGSWKFIGEHNDPNTKKYINDIREIKHIEKPYEKKPFDISSYGKSYQTILKKYTEKEFNKLMKGTFGKEYNYKEIRDDQGNIWYEFEIPHDYKIGSGPIKAFQLGGQIKAYENGGAVDYSDTEEVTINGKTYYRYKVKSGDTKSDISEKYNLWNEQGILNSVNSNFSDIKDQPNYAKNINRMWVGDQILVGGPDFDKHVEYSTARKKYKDSFKNISEDELWSTISAIGHLETGSLIKYKKPEGRVYVTGKDLDEFGNTIPGGQYDLDNHPFLGQYESGMDDAYSHVSSADALGRFGIKIEHLNKYGKDVLGYKEEQDWKANYLNNKDDQRKLMQYLITDVYPQEILQIRHSYPEASSQYSDFQLIAALHRAGQPELRDQLSKGEFSKESVKGDISVGGYTERVNRYLNPDLDVSESPFFMESHDLREPFKNIPTYKFGGSINVKDEVIGDMLENGAFLPKFKMGSEKSIEGMLGKYKIKKGYDDDVQLPYIEYNVQTENIEDNKIYYDNNDIVDITKQKQEQKRFFSRMKDIVTRYNKGETITQAEKNEMENFGLLDNKPKAEVKVKDRVAPMKYGGASMPLSDINVSKDLFNKTDGNNYGLSLASQILLYETRVNGILDKDKKFNKLKSIYNRLNTIYYNEAKASKMTVLDYMKSLNN